MSQSQPVVSLAAADVFTGYYKRARMTQGELAKESGIALTSLQKKLAGNAPITASDLVALSRAVGVAPEDAMVEVMREVAKREAASEIPVSLEAHRKRRTPAEMTEEEMEGESNAAITDPELEYDEPDPT